MSKSISLSDVKENFCNISEEKIKKAQKLAVTIMEYYFSYCFFKLMIKIVYVISILLYS